MSKASFVIEGFAAEPKRRVSQSGKQMLDVSVAHTERRKNKQSGQWENATDQNGQEITLWARATFFDETADAIAAVVSKGTLVRIEGMPRMNVYTTNQGETRASVDVQFASLSVVPRTASQGGPGGGNAAPSAQQWGGGQNAPQNSAQGFGGFDDTSPF